MTRLKRPCSKCGKYFIPTGKSEALCLDCFKHRFDKYNNYRKTMNQRRKYLVKLIKDAKKEQKESHSDIYNNWIIEAERELKKLKLEEQKHEN